jgi:hypothetical protein
MVVKGGLAPRAVNIPAGAMSAPRLQAWILATRRTQVLVTSWRTILSSTPCHDPNHAALCTMVLLDSLDVLHADLSRDVWMRHPIGGAR